VVCILGARQVGKTTLAKMLYPNWHYIDLQKPDDQERIIPNPGIFFKTYPDSVILDEAQDFPLIFNVLRGVIDEARNVKGRFIITGSSSPELLKNLSESLAGRVAIVELGTLKANEIAKSSLSDFYSWFSQSFTNINPKQFVIGSKPLEQKYIDQALFEGGYPEVILATEQSAKQNWFEFYEKTYLYRDVAMLFPHINKNNFQHFFRTLAYLSGTIINKAQLARDIECSETSIRNYLAISEGTFLWYNIPSFEKVGYKSLVKMPKGYVADSGLLHYLTRINNIEMLRQHPMIGKSFEGFVIGEIIKGLQSQSIGSWEAYHYRTRNGVEIDLILEGRFGLLPIEIKYGTSVKNRSILNLSKFMENEKLSFGVVINQADEILWLTPNIIQIPVKYL
ncbi:MAG TPA: DUF4143 domain-containing protein, partial [Aquella sp.]|nr:DUF4143 domain-containing protein [Aquella sp.]